MGWPLNSERFSKGEARRLEVLCKRLLKYASSKTQSIQQIAVDAVWALAVEDPALHIILAKIISDSRTPTQTHNEGREEDKTLATQRAFEFDDHFAFM